MNWFNLESSSPLVDSNTIVVIAIFCWFIWKSRNDIVFCNNSSSPSKIIVDACRMIQDQYEAVSCKDEG